MQVENHLENNQNNNKDNAETTKSNKDTVPAVIKKCIKSIIDKKGLAICDVNTKCITPNGGNYLGDLYEVDIKGKTKDGNEEVHIFLKKVLDIEQLVTILSLNEIYKNELYFYREIAVMFRDIQEQWNVPENERYKTVESYDESSPELIVLDNISSKGFVPGRKDTMSLEFAEMAVKQLARFHSLSFVIKEKNPQYYNQNVKSLTHTLFHFNNWDDFFLNVAKMPIKKLKHEDKIKMEALLPKLMEKYRNYLQDVQSVTCCLCHGDYRANNIMIKEANGKITESYVIDYQIIHYGCPVLDFLVFIFVGTDREFRRKHLNYLKNLYYESMRSFLLYFNIDVSSVFSKDNFERTYKDRLDYGLIMFLNYAPFIFAPEDDLPSFDTDKLSKTHFETKTELTERMQGIFDDFNEWGYL